MNIRLVSEDDRDSVFQMLSEAIGASYLEAMEDEFQRSVAGEYIGLVLEEGGEVLAYACARRVVQTFKLETIATNEDVRSRGLGSALLRQLEDLVRQSGLTILNVDTDPDDLRTVNFYQKNGFKVSGWVENEYLPGRTKIHLSKIL